MYEFRVLVIENPYISAAIALFAAAISIRIFKFFIKVFLG